MVHRGPDADGTWASTPDARGWGAAAGPPPALPSSIFRPLALGQHDSTRSPGHALVLNGEIYNYVRRCGARMQADEGQAFASTGDTAVMLRAARARHGPDAATWNCAACSRLRMLGSAASAGCCWRATRSGIQAALRGARMPHPDAGTGRSPSPPSVRAHTRPPACSARHMARPARPSPVGVVERLRRRPRYGSVQGCRPSVLPGRLMRSSHDRRAASRSAARTFWAYAPGFAALAGPTESDDGRPSVCPGARDRDYIWPATSPWPSSSPAGLDSQSRHRQSRSARGPEQHRSTPSRLAFEEAGTTPKGPIARRVARCHRHPAPASVVLTQQPLPRQQLEPALDSLDQPTFDGLNCYYMSQAIRAAGFTVALSGTGGDELFGGYASYRDLPVLQRWSQRTAWVPGSLTVAAATLASRLLSRSGKMVPAQTRWAKLPDMVRRGDDLLALYQLAYALFSPRVRRRDQPPEWKSPAPWEKLATPTSFGLWVR